MAATARVLTRLFIYNGMTLPDPGAHLSPDQVRAFYSTTYSELTNALVEGPETTDRSVRFKFVRAVGTKG